MTNCDIIIGGNYRQNTKEGEDDNFILKEEEGVVTFSCIYLVGGNRWLNDLNLNEQDVAFKMRVSKNGKGSEFLFQQGKTKND